MSESDQRERWAGHFQEVLKRECPVARIELFHLEELEISIEPLSEDEIKVCIRRMKSNKAACIDNVSAELYKILEDENAKLLKRLFDKIWAQERVLDEWFKGIIVKLPKKGDLMDCNNWRAITLLVVASKIFARGIF